MVKLWKFLRVRKIDLLLPLPLLQKLQVVVAAVISAMHLDVQVVLTEVRSPTDFSLVGSDWLTHRII